MKKVFLFTVLLVVAGVVHAQQAGLPPVRTTDKGPVLRKTTVTVPVSTSSAVTPTPHTQAGQTAPIRKTDPGGITQTMPAVTRTLQNTGGQEKASGLKAVPPSATPVKAVGKQ